MKMEGGMPAQRRLRGCGLWPLPPAAALGRIRAHLRHGGIIAYPTESCYGLGCDPRSRPAVRALLRLKGRPQEKGLILIAHRFEQIERYVAPLSGAQRAQMRPTWPGPHTWLLPAARRTPRWLRGRHDTLAVRVTAHPLAARLCQALGTALVSTSANRAGLRPLVSGAACARTFGRSVLVIPGLVGKSRKPSTIQDLLSGRILRK